MFKLLKDLFFPPMRFTVLYTCTRGYNCFRTVTAQNEEEAARLCLVQAHNFGKLTEVRPFVGSY